MNYFELFQIPQSIDVNQTLLRSKYLELSRAFHPDVNESSSEDALSAVNKAYSALKSRKTTLAHLFELNNIDLSEVKLPTDFLMEMMMLNEALEDSNEKSIAIAKVSELEDSLNLEEDELVNSFDRSADFEDEGVDILNKLATVTNKKQYLLRVKDNLNNFAAAQ